MITLSQPAHEMLLTARRSTPGALIFAINPPVALRELQDNGLVNSHFKLTRRGAAEHARRTAEFGGRASAEAAGGHADRH